MLRRVATLAIVSVLALGAVAPARAATFTVTTTADAGAGSLRQAVIDANASADASNTIAFSLPASSTIVLASPLEDINSETLIFDATSSPGLSIDGGATGGAVQPFLVNGGGSTAVSFRNVSYTDGAIFFGFNFEFSFDESSEGTIDGELGGADILVVKTGAGTTTLNEGHLIDLSAGSGFRSEARIDQGTLAVNGDFYADSLLVGPQGTLAGDSDTSFGVIAAVTVQGRVAPSTTTGTLRIEGPVRFESTSVLDADVLPGDLGDRVETSGGSVDVVSGARLAIRADPPSFTGPSTVTLLTSDTAINGQFALITDYAFLAETISQTPTSIAITLAPDNTLPGISLTPNQTVVAGTVESVRPGASGDLLEALTAIDRSTAAEIPALLDALGGESLTAFATGRQILAERTSRALHRRARDPAWGEARAFYAQRFAPAAPVFAGAGLGPLGFLAAGPGPVAASADASGPRASGEADSPVRAGAWLDAFGLVGDLEGSAGEADLDTTLVGGTLGVDLWLAERVLLGVAAGYARSDIDPEHRKADVTGDTIQAALYTGWSDPRGFVSAYGRYAYTFQDSTRRIASSQLQRTARADWNAQDYGAGAEAGVTLVSLGGFGLQPIAGVDWLRLTEESYRESGAGALALDVHPEDLESVSGRFGGRLFGRIDMRDAGELVPELRAFWQREFGDRDRLLRARLIGASTGGALAVRGAELPRDVVIVGAGWSTSVGDALQVLLDYDALLDRDRVEHQGNLAVRVRF